MFEFAMPAMNLFGENSIEGIANLANRLNGKKALIITDKNLVAFGLCAKIEEVLNKENVEYTIFDEVSPNPSKDNVYDAVKIYNESGCDFIIGLGGGSPNDCAKAVSILINNPGTLEEFAGGNMSKVKGVPIIAVNTTAGTASEISRAYLISDEVIKEKIISKDFNCLPYASINDPQLMTGLPAHVTAQTGLDALAHALESYVCNISTVMTKELSTSATKLVFDNLENTITNPKSIEYRQNMIYAQFLAGMAFCNSGVGLGHAMAHAIGATYHMGHGLCTALVLAEIMRFNAKTQGSEYAKLARRLFAEECNGKDDMQAANVLIEKVEELSESVGVKKPLSEFGIKKEELKDLAEKTLRDGNVGRNPVIPTLEEVVQIFENIF